MITTISIMTAPTASNTSMTVETPTFSLPGSTFVPSELAGMKYRRFENEL
jgi:hypothetical protein